MHRLDGHITRFCDAWDRFVESPAGVVVGWIWLAIVVAGAARGMGLI